MVRCAEDECTSRGCCWDPTSPKAWCYHTSNPALNVTDPATACPNHNNVWADCGRDGVDEETCLARGCCWDVTSSHALCYYKGVVPRPAMSWFAVMVSTGPTNDCGEHATRNAGAHDTSHVTITRQ